MRIIFKDWCRTFTIWNIPSNITNISNSKGSASIFKYNTTKLDDVSDSNLKEWGIYLKNWYRSKSLNNEEEDKNENVDAKIELRIDSETTGYLQCYIVSSNYSSSRLDYDWSSSNESILTISSYSTITIVGDGTCQITCVDRTTKDIGILDVEVKDGKIVSFTSRFKE